MTVKQGTSKNKGEISELYSFVYILGNGFLELVDGNLQPLDNQIEFFKLIRSDKIECELNNAAGIVTIDSDGIRKVEDQSRIRTLCDNLLTLLQNSPKAIDENEKSVQSLLQLFETNVVSAKSQDKSDFCGCVKVNTVPGLHTLGFSVKSQMGGAPTLINVNRLNAAMQYEVIQADGSPLTKAHQEKLLKLNSAKVKYWVKARVQAVYDNGMKLRFNKPRGECFNFNLKLIDMMAPEILGSVLLEHYRKESRQILTLESLVKQLCDSDHIDRYPKLAEMADTVEDVKTMLLYKLKRILCAFATGATVTEKWDGQDKANGGIVIVMKDGNVVCLELFTRDALMQYLISTTQFDGPSSKRHPYGSFYLEGDKLMFDLQAQVRFVE